MGQIQNLEDFLDFLRRRLWLIIAIAIAGAAVSAVIAKSRPDSFEAFAVIEVQGVTTDQTSPGSAQLLQSIEQRLTTRENLLAVISRHGLYADLPALSADERAALLRKNISFEGIAAVGNNPYGGVAQLSAIIIKASDGNADLAARIANDFAQSVLDMSSSNKLDEARDTLAFYREEERRISDQISSVEAEVAAYKNTHDVSSMTEARRDELVAVEDDMRQLDQSLVALMEEQRQLSTKGNLRATEQRRLQDLDGQIAVLTEQKAALSSRKTELTAALASQPEVERALAGYQRQLDQLQDSLSVVTARLTEAETASKLAERQQGQRFALLDRALTPEHAVGSGGKKLFVAGAVASLLAGLALAFLLDLMKPVIRTSTQMERQLGVRPIVAIPELDLPDRKRRGGGGPRMGEMRQKVMALPRVVLICSALTLVLFVTAAVS